MISEQGLSEIQKTIKTIKGLREMLFDQLDNLRLGKISTKQAQIIARMADTILSTARVEMNAYKHPLSDAFLKLPDHPSLEIVPKKKGKGKK